MPWQGFNFENATVINECIVRDDVFTSLHIEEFELEDVILNVEKRN